MNRGKPSIFSSARDVASGLRNWWGEAQMTGTQSGSPDSALDQPMMIVGEDTYAPPRRAHAPPIPPVMRMEIRGTGPLEEGDAIVGGAWDEDEEEVEREGPAELVIEEEIHEERPWEGGIAQVVYQPGHTLVGQM